MKKRQGPRTQAFFCGIGNCSSRAVEIKENLLANSLKSMLAGAQSFVLDPRREAYTDMKVTQKESRMREGSINEECT